MFGRDGDNELDGGRGGDRLGGGSGGNQLSGGRGADELRGGGGADQFFFDTDEGDDTVFDITFSADRILL